MTMSYLTPYQTTILGQGGNIFVYVPYIENNQDNFISVGNVYTFSFDTFYNSQGGRMYYLIVGLYYILHFVKYSLFTKEHGTGSIN